MATTSKTVTNTYTDLALGASAVYIQNKGSVQIEVYVDSALPADTEEGIYLLPESPGVTISLTGSDTIYVKVERHEGVSTIVCVH